MLQTTQVWELWREDRALDIVDSLINESFVFHEVMRCIQIGLLCVQEDAMDRLIKKRRCNGSTNNVVSSSHAE
jgi:hypothetical protein